MTFFNLVISIHPLPPPPSPEIPCGIYVRIVRPAGRMPITNRP